MVLREGRGGLDPAPSCQRPRPAQEPRIVFTAQLLSILKVIALQAWSWVSCSQPSAWGQGLGTEPQATDLLLPDTHTMSFQGCLVLYTMAGPPWLSWWDLGPHCPSCMMRASYRAAASYPYIFNSLGSYVLNDHSFVCIFSGTSSSFPFDCPEAEAVYAVEMSLIPSCTWASRHSSGCWGLPEKAPCPPLPLPSLQSTPSSPAGVWSSWKERCFV